jgi:phage shock protein E
MKLALTAVLLTSSILTHAAEPQIPNRKIDFAAHLRAAQKTDELRQSRRLTEEQFLDYTSDPKTVILDARSESKYKLRHIKGAINLPFTEFTEESLAKVIPTKDTRVLIYCNNNFEGDRRAFADKRAPASLNISTFVNLTIYGYTNVYELGPLLDVKKTVLPFAGTSVSE